LQNLSLDYLNKKRVNSFKAVILFRADGNSEIGLGHVYRCLALAERVHQFYQPYFAIQNPSKTIINELKGYSVPVILPKNTDYYDEANYILSEIIPRINAKIVVIDGYCFDTKYQHILKKNKNIKLVCIDDFQPFLYEADVVINHADGIDASLIHLANDAKVYTGSEFALLRKPFIGLRSLYKHIKSITKLFICFGGADPQNFTLKVLKAAIIADCFDEINIVTGGAYLYSELLCKFTFENRKIKIYSNLSVDKMLEVMSKCELAIVPASTIALECRAVGMIMIAGTTAGNQQNILKGLLKLEYVKSIGDFSIISELQLIEEIKKMVISFNGYSFLPTNNSEDPVLEIFKTLSRND
jgi:UDP-2,4-diacetamido-2,4,6-trideoxy-beta-L-altropyranose hydrolase